MSNVHFSSKETNVETPADLFLQLSNEFNFTLDACAAEENAQCRTFYTKENSCLDKDWSFHTVFMNPPYGRQIGNFIKKAYEESQKENGALVVMLLPARTDTKWFHDYCIKGTIRFIRGRVKFTGMKSMAPFPSMIVIFRPIGKYIMAEF
jgi:phage N-6-adenine-methyltransferase